MSSIPMGAFAAFKVKDSQFFGPGGGGGKQQHNSAFQQQVPPNENGKLINFVIFTYMNSVLFSVSMI
jgi:hypothetical protein